MKFQNFYFENELHYGVVQDEKLYDLSQVPAAPRSLKDWIECGNPVDQLDSWLKEAPVVPKEQIQPAPAAASPEKIFCIGLNYRAHAAESGGQLPAFPEVFSKFSNALAAHGQTVRLSPYAGQVDYEAELVVIIGKTCRDVTEEEAAKAVFGYTCGNDVSAREQQTRVSQWLTGKSQDGFAPVGPWIVTADELGDPAALSLDIKLYRGEQLCQDSNTNKMIFSVPYLISYLSRYMTLKPGDMIFTGTPEGVILGQDEKHWLEAGEKLTVEIEGIGKLVNTIG